MNCKNCGKPIHYNKDLQTYHHDHNNYDACAFRPGPQQRDQPRAEPET